MDAMNTHGRRVLYISHGAGPLPVLGDERHVEMVENLRHLAATIPRPDVILLVSAHWEETKPTVTSGAHPPLLFDYYGFPQESYEYEYPASGHSGLEQSVTAALEGAGFDVNVDAERGFDHGMFIPLMLMYPQADVPCVQLSLLRGLDAARHLDMGRALAALDVENLLVVGSGFSFHNMRAFSIPDTAESRAWNVAFDRWLIETCTADMIPDERAARLIDWDSAPHARYCHPREEHLLPLHVCCGLAGAPCTEQFDLEIFGKKASAFLW